MLRLFFALQPAPELGLRIIANAAPLLGELGELGAQATPASHLHATLCFLGAVAPDRLDALRAAAGKVRASPCQIEFDSFEYWDKPRVVVAGASRESSAATSLSAALHEATRAAGFTPDAKPFRAHLTLARKISPTAAQKISWPLKFSPGFVVVSTRFALMESRRGELGSIYSVVEEWTLCESPVDETMR